MRLQTFIEAIESYIEEIKKPVDLINLFCGHCGAKLWQEDYCQACGKIFRP